MPKTNTKNATKSSAVKTATTITKVVKRNGELVKYDRQKIADVAFKALSNTNEGGTAAAEKIAQKVESDLLQVLKEEPNFIPHVESIQDLVEKHLMLEGYYASAKQFIIYRQKRTEVRDSLRMTKLAVSETFKTKVDESKKYFTSSLGEFVYYRTYSRWLEEKGRRETWIETVQRFVDFMKENLKDKLTDAEYKEVHESILNQETIPSMRLLWSSGDAARATNVAAYNCSYVSISELRHFAEIMYISMCGCGAGFSVEKASIQKLPEIKEQTGEKLQTHVVADSKEGWADALLLGLQTWFDGKDIDFDYSQVRPKGARLKTMGGRASGPQPLMDLMSFTRGSILSKQGKKLSSLDVHDIACKIGEVVVAGGVRRSAMISLSDLSDLDMRDAKQGQFWLDAPQRSMANNSAIYNEKPSAEQFLEEWLSLIQSKSGERGIFIRNNLKTQLPQRRLEVFEPYIETAGTNPCGEIILRSQQFCNLTAIVVRQNDTKQDLLRKIRVATILGTYQASLTNFPYISKEWKQNCEEEALLGVSFTGYYDNETCRNEEVLQEMRDESVKINKKYAKRFGINQSTCVTCVKPSGNSSQLLDTSSGMHARYSQYYIRRIRINATDPLFKMLSSQGVKFSPEVGQTLENATVYVFEFPVKAPEGAILKDDISALDLLEEWKKIKTNFTEHNPSVTIYVGADEWIKVANWVYENWDIVGGLSFLQRSDHVYQLAPYEEIDKKTYEQMLPSVAGIDFSKLVYFESTDKTHGAKEYACVGGACEI